MILLAEFYFNGGNIVKRVASDFYYSKSTDTIGVKEYQGRIVGRPSFKSTIGCIIWGGKTTVSVGDIEVANVDGDISGWVDYDFRDMRCVLLLVARGAAYSAAKIIQTCIIDDVQRVENAVVVKLRGIETLLDKPLQPLLYDSITAAENVSQNGCFVCTIAQMREISV